MRAASNERGEPLTHPLSSFPEGLFHLVYGCFFPSFLALNTGDPQAAATMLAYMARGNLRQRHWELFDLLRPGDWDGTSLEDADLLMTEVIRFLGGNRHTVVGFSSWVPTHRAWEMAVFKEARFRPRARQILVDVDLAAVFDASSQEAAEGQPASPKRSPLSLSTLTFAQRRRLQQALLALLQIEQKLPEGLWSRELGLRASGWAYWYDYWLQDVVMRASWRPQKGLGGTWCMPPFEINVVSVRLDQLELVDPFSSQFDALALLITYYQPRSKTLIVRWLPTQSLSLHNTVSLSPVSEVATEEKGFSATLLLDVVARLTASLPVTRCQLILPDRLGEHVRAQPWAQHIEEHLLLIRDYWAHTPAHANKLAETALGWLSDPGFAQAKKNLYRPQKIPPSV